MYRDTHRRPFPFQPYLNLYTRNEPIVRDVPIATRCSREARGTGTAVG